MRIFSFVLLFTSILFGSTVSISAQVSINTDNSDPHPSAMLEVKSTDKGMLIPRVTNTSAVTVPGGGLAEGLLVYQTDAPKGFYYFNGTSWEAVGGSGGSGDNLGNHIATQSIQLFNISSSDRDNNITPLPGMMIYNTDLNKMQVWQKQAPKILEQFNSPDATETGCTTIAQRFATNTSTTLNEIYANIDYNGGMGDITLTIFYHGTGAGTGNTQVYQEVFPFATVNGNGNSFVLGTPLDLPLGQYTFQVTQSGNSNMIANIKKIIAQDWDVVDQDPPNQDPYGGGYFSKNGANFEVTDDSAFPIIVITRYDLGFSITTQFASWVPSS